MSSAQQQVTSLGTIQSIEEVSSMDIRPVFSVTGSSGSRLGISQLISSVVSGVAHMEGYKVVTDQHTYYVLIDNEQSCCESFGYLASDDDLAQFVGADLREVRLTDTALNQQRVNDSEYWAGGDGGIQFVDFVTDREVLQLAVYNGHNGYYGHGIVVACDDKIVHSDTL